MYSHQVVPTCDSVLNGMRCSRSRKLVGEQHRCFRSHDYKVRLFMGAMRVPHELGFYGLSDARRQAVITPPAEPDAEADWMKSDVEDHTSELDEPMDEAMADAGVEEYDEVVPVPKVDRLNLDAGHRPQTPEGDNRSATDLILFT